MSKASTKYTADSARFRADLQPALERVRLKRRAAALERIRRRRPRVFRGD